MVNVNQSNVENLALNISIPVSVRDELFEFLIKKEGGHSFQVTLLKNGQYIFVSLLDGKNEFPIEHIEFYSNESEVEVIGELKFVLNKLKANSSRVSDLKKDKKAAELYEDGEWKRYGYPSTKIQKNKL